MTENRTEAEIVGDIICIWSQVWRPEERTLWSQIAESDLTKQLSLESSMRLPESFIEKDIKQFAIGKNHKASLLKQLKNAPNGPYPQLDNSSDTTTVQVNHVSIDAPSDTTNMVVNHVSLDTDSVPSVVPHS